MSKVCESYIDFNASCDVTSIALNGLLLPDDNISNIRYYYTIDAKERSTKQGNGEMALLYSQVLSTAKRLDIKLVPINDTVTRMLYTYEIRSNVAGIVAMVILQLIMAFAFAMVFSLVETAMPTILVSAIAFVVTMAVFSFLPLIVVQQSSKKRILGKMNKYFAERVNSYIEIVKRNQRQQYYQ